MRLVAPVTSSALLSPHGQASLFQGYAVPAATYDEAFLRTGLPRPHWQHTVQMLENLGSAELSLRWEQARGLIRDNGITYNVYGDPQGMQRPWELDAVPLVIAAAEWQQLETALIQRVQVLNTLLADVYGPQTFLHHGLVPPELVFAHPNFLRPCYNLKVPQQRYLHLYAADLMRSADGQWWVLADRTQSPAGAGYALENRLVLSRILSDLFRAEHVQRLAPFFDALRKTLLNLAPQHRDNPRIVLLTPGPYNATYFEHAYLARYLGYTLVEGGDLTVRDNRVFLKTLGGLQPVDVIVRRQDDTFCDPLELHQDSVLGIAGLVQAVRAGNVAVANALGSGWLETPALMAVLPALCRQVLGEELRLPSLPTWWCGQPEALAYVCEHLDSLRLLPTFPTAPFAPRHGAHLSHAQRTKLLRRLQARPYYFVAQTPMASSTMPVWHSDGGMVPRSLVVRVYVTATTEGYVVMPGGLTLVSATPSTPSMTLQHGRGSKDTWVVADRPPLPFSLLPPPGQPIALRRSGYELPSRVADNLYWLGRYVERAEGGIRLLRSIANRLTDESGLTGSTPYPLLLRPLQALWPAVHPRASLTGLEQTLLTVMLDVQVPDSLNATLAAVHQVASKVRDRISLDSWRILLRLQQDMTAPQAHSSLPLTSALEMLNQTLITLAAFSGLGVENMTRGPGWHFLDMGRRLERALQTVTILRSLVVEVSDQEEALLETLLDIADSSMTYRSRYLTTLQFAPVLDLLLTDASNPRSVVYQLLALSEHVEHLPREPDQAALSPAQRLALLLLSSLQLCEIAVLCEVRGERRRGQLDAFLARLLTDLPALSDTVTNHYLSHAESSRHLATSDPASLA
ncbi:MAG: circularly permuted type 2 ATP-grasp protein [Candidatus Tectimicrobiota bacterium]